MKHTFDSVENTLSHMRMYEPGRFDGRMEGVSLNALKPYRVPLEAAKHAVIRAVE